MRNRLRTWPIVLLVTIVAGSTFTVARAWGNGRSAVAGRQQVQAALAVAMADGALSKWEMHSIIRKGKKALSPGELQGLQRRLDDLYAAGSSTLAFPAGTGGEVVLSTSTRQTFASADPAEKPVTGTGTGAASIAQTALVATDESGTAETAVYDPAADLAAEESPFRDEPLPEADPQQGLQEVPATVMPDAPGCFAEGISEGFPVIYEGCGKPMGPFGHRVGMLAHNLGSLAMVGASNLFVQSCDPCGMELPDIRFQTAVDAFKGPIDLDGFNGDFGVRFAINAGFPISQAWGLGLQVGTSGIVSNFHGTQFTGSRARSQSFTTVGMFQRAPWGAQRLKYGFAFDWLYDRYYWPFRMSQWRVKLAYDWSPCTEIGMLATIPNDGDTAWLDHGSNVFSEERFKPIAQGSLYYKRCWSNGTEATFLLGIAEDPGHFLFGSDVRIPVSYRWSVVGNVNYIEPSASGAWGRDEEIWNVSLGIELKFGGGNHCLNKSYAPMFRLADNSTFAIGRF